MAEQNINVNEIIGTGQNLVDRCRDEQGNPIFRDNINPFSMLSQLTNANGNMNRNITKDEYAANCNDMLRQMGVNNIDFNQLMASQSGNNQNAKKTKKRKDIVSRRR